MRGDVTRLVGGIALGALLAACPSSGDDPFLDPDPTPADDDDDAPCTLADPPFEDPLIATGEWNAPFSMSDIVELQRVVMLSDDVAAVGGVGGVFLFDVSGPTPSLLGRWGEPGQAIARHLAHLPPDHVAITGWGPSVTIIDVSDPAAPETAAEIFMSGATGLGWSAPTLYVLTAAGEVGTWDLSDPADPQSGSSIGDLGSPWEMAVGDGAAYVADTNGALGVLDLSTPGAPTLAGTVDLPGAPLAVAHQDDLVAVALGAGGLALLDASSPLAPTLLGVHPQGRHVGSVSFDGDHLWMTTNEDVRAVDVSDPSDPAPVAVRATSSWARGAAAAGGRVTVADWSGVRRFDLVETDAPSLVPDARTLYVTSEVREQTLTVTNRGGATLCIESIEADDDEVEIDLGGGALLPGEAVSLTVSVPPEWDGDAVLVFSSDDPAEPALEVGVRTTGAGSSDVAIGQLAPDIVLDLASGGTWNLADHLGRPVVISFFATWCSFCPEQMIDLDRTLYPRWQEQGVELVGIASAESAAVVGGWASQYGVGFPLLLDSDRAVLDAYFQETDSMSVLYPQDWVIGPDGRVAHRSTHYLPEELQRVVDELLGP